MSIKRLCLLVFVCFLALPGNPVFGLGKSDTPSKTDMGLYSQDGSAAVPRSFTFGAVFDEEAYNKLPVQDAVVGHPAFSSRGGGTRGPVQTPPASSLKEFAPIPGDQGDVPSCGGWAAAYGAKTILESITLKRTNRFLTTRNAYSPLYTYLLARQIDRRGVDDYGSNILTITSLMTEFSIPRDSEFKKSNAFLDDKRINISFGSESDNSKKYKIQSTKRVFHNRDFSTMENRITSIKENIFKGNPVIIGMHLPESFKLAKERWNPDANEVINPDGGHALCVVGYDDNKYGGAFEVLNSWGEYWGNGGYTWIDYRTFDKFLTSAIVLLDDYSPYEKPFEWTSKITVQTEEAGQELPVRFSEDGVYTPRTSLKTGTRIRFVLEGNNGSISNGPIYPYVFYADETLGKTVQVWPPSGSAASITIAERKLVTIPANNQWITTNGTVNADRFVFLFSRQELDIAAIRSSFEKQNGAIVDRLGAVMENRLIPAACGLYAHSNMESIVDFLDMESVMGMVFSVQYDKDGKTPLDMVKISGGSFTMGSPKSDPYRKDNEIQRTVRVTDFFIGQTEVTVGDFREFIADSNYKTSADKAGQSYVLNRQTMSLEMLAGYNWSNPSFAQEDNYPVVQVSLYDAMEYCNWRSRKEGLKVVYTITGDTVTIDNNANGYRLPTEAEWEYACRAGTSTPYNTGNTITPVAANFIDSGNLKTAAAKSYSANEWGLYEMHGNVFEWTQDSYERTENVTVRGGSWGDSAPWARSAFRLPFKKDITVPTVGFRLARSAK